MRQSQASGYLRNFSPLFLVKEIIFPEPEGFSKKEHLNSDKPPLKMKRISDTRTENILNSLEGLQKTAAPDFFYTRLVGRMQNGLDDKKNILFLRPVFLTTALSIVLLINIVSLKQLRTVTQKPDIEKATIESFADAYNLNSSASY